jgi:hypothetical protein
MSGAERLAAYRARQAAAGLPDTSRPRRSRLPFVGVDGEGAGKDELGRQQYRLFRIGERELYTGEPLKTAEILRFIADTPPDSILVGFAFGYDTTMILRDLAERQQRRLFEPRVIGPGRSPFTWHREFDIDYLPRNHLRIRRVRLGDNGRRSVIKGSTRTIYETFGFFQKSFLKTLEDFSIGSPEDRQRIAVSKAGRGAVGWTIDQLTRDYCALECWLLAELMEALRDYCEAAECTPRTWNGAGKLARVFHVKHSTPTAKQVRELVPPEVQRMAAEAYYGGRFEVTRIGRIDGPVFEYDLRSAYPAQMPALPCLVHGRWDKAGGDVLSRPDRIGVAAVSYRHDRPQAPLCGLPIRTSKGHLLWPKQGAGVYWANEIRSAEALGAKVKWHEGWIYRKECDCGVFDWVEPLYEYRRSIGSTGPGYPIKLAINSLYGLLAQRKGNGRFANLAWAGLITAGARAEINAAIALDPDAICMIATDAVYSTRPLELPVGPFLGAWEETKLSSLFIVQPGLYWDPERRKRKSRGLSGRFFEEPGRTEAFENAWDQWCSDHAGPGRSGLYNPWPGADVPQPDFIGLRLALARGKPGTAGTWIDDRRHISFDPRNKRDAGELVLGSLETSPKPGGPGLRSLPHRDLIEQGTADLFDLERSAFDEQPDWIDLGTPTWD